MIRRNPLLLMLFVMAATILLQGIGVTYADTGTAGERQLHPYAIRDPNVNPNLSAKARARYQRDASIQKRHESKKAIKALVEEQSRAASDKTNKGVAK